MADCETNQPTDAECIDKIISDPESAYRAMLNQDAEIERLRARVTHLESGLVAIREDLSKISNGNVLLLKTLGVPVIPPEPA